MSAQSGKTYAFLVRCGAAGGCHQRADRSLFFRGVQFPICARCTGLIVGQTLGIIAFALGLRTPWPLDIALIALMAADALAQQFLARESTNPRRVVTGLLAGTAEIQLLCKGVLWLASLA